jgi:hypothetical protein
MLDGVIFCLFDPSGEIIYGGMSNAKSPDGATVAWKSRTMPIILFKMARFRRHMMLFTHDDQCYIDSCLFYFLI